MFLSDSLSLPSRGHVTSHSAHWAFGLSIPKASLHVCRAVRVHICVCKVRVCVCFIKGVFYVFCLYVGMSVHALICVCVSVYVSQCLRLCMSINVRAPVYVCVSVCVFVCMYQCLSVIEHDDPNYNDTLKSLLHLLPISVLLSVYTCINLHHSNNNKNNNMNK